MSFLSRFFPTAGLGNIRLYYILQVFQNCWFIGPNWAFFWLKFMSFGEVGLVEVVGGAMAIVLEIPTGAIADLLGKRRALLLGSVLYALGIGIAAFAESKYGIFAGALISKAGGAFYSGSSEALAYDSLLEAKQTQHFGAISSKANLIAIIVTVITTFIGGWLFIQEARLPYIGWMLSALCSIPIIWLMREPRVDSYRFNWNNFWMQQILGFKELFIPQLRQISLLLLTLSSITTLYLSGIYRIGALQWAGFDATWQSYVTGTLIAISAIVLIFFEHIQRAIGDLRGLLLSGFAIGTGLLLLLVPMPMPIVFFVFIGIGVIGNVARNWISVTLNHAIDSKLRATTLSTLSLLAQIPYLFLGYYLGLATEQGWIWVFTLLFGFIVLVVVLFTQFHIWFRFLYGRR